MKAHIDVGAVGLVHTVRWHACQRPRRNTSCKIAAWTGVAWGGYQVVDKREEAQGSKMLWPVVMRPDSRRVLDPERLLHQLREKNELFKANVRAKVEHPLGVIKPQFGYAKVRYGGLYKITSRLKMLFALDHLWMACKRFMSAYGSVRLNGREAASGHPKISAEFVQKVPKGKAIGQGMSSADLLNGDSQTLLGNINASIQCLSGFPWGKNSLHFMKKLDVEDKEMDPLSLLR